VGEYKIKKNHIISTFSLYIICGYLANCHSYFNRAPSLNLPVGICVIPNIIRSREINVHFWHSWMYHRMHKQLVTCNSINYSLAHVTWNEFLNTVNVMCDGMKHFPFFSQIYCSEHTYWRKISKKSSQVSNQCKFLWIFNFLGHPWHVH
jgi:hypothetical protein